MENKWSEAERAIITRICKGDRTALPEFRRILKDDRALVEAGNLAARAECALLDLIAEKGDLAMRETVPAKLTALRQELGPAATALERLLIDRAVTCWLQVAWADFTCYRKMGDSFNMEFGDYLQRQQDRAHKRFMSAVKMLATVRKFARPVQVHVTAAAAPTVNGARMPPRIAERMNGHAAPDIAALGREL